MKGKSEKALKSNIKTEYEALKAKNSGRSNERIAKQAYAIAKSVQRKGK